MARQILTDPGLEVVERPRVQPEGLPLQPAFDPAHSVAEFPFQPGAFSGDHLADERQDAEHEDDAAEQRHGDGERPWHHPVQEIRDRAQHRGHDQAQEDGCRHLVEPPQRREDRVHDGSHHQDPPGVGGGRLKGGVHAGRVPRAGWRLPSARLPARRGGHSAQRPA